uniref:Uncharacterized protein n=1 Tax=Nelumbo nucifera TaxID=4432 RepID=A0A822Z3I5_NELNU|nr:TPA_asm: hypothetical protein HUJ06_013680 [Nelumbo nucifera]
MATRGHPFLNVRRPRDVGRRPRGLGYRRP